MVFGNPPVFALCAVFSRVFVCCCFVVPIHCRSRKIKFALLPLRILFGNFQSFRSTLLADRAIADGNCGRFSQSRGRPSDHAHPENRRKKKPVGSFSLPVEGGGTRHYQVSKVPSRTNRARSKRPRSHALYREPPNSRPSKAHDPEKNTCGNHAQM